MLLCSCCICLEVVDACFSRVLLSKSTLGLYSGESLIGDGVRQSEIWPLFVPAIWSKFVENFYRDELNHLSMILF